MLPTISGVNLCRQYRQSGKTAVLTTADTILIKSLVWMLVQTITKPVDVVELARASWTALTLVERRYADRGRFKAPSDKSDRGTGQVTMQLSVREFQMMEYLMRHPHQVLSREQIEQALWEWGTRKQRCYNAGTTSAAPSSGSWSYWKQSTVWVTA